MAMLPGHAENELFLDSIWGRHCHLFHPSIRLQNITLASSPGSLIDCPLKPLHRSLFRCSILSTWPPAMIAVMLHPVMVRMTIVNAVQWLSFRTLVSAPCFLSHWYISVPTVVHPCETTWCIDWIAHAPIRLTSLQLSWRPLYFCSFSTFSWRVYPCFHRWRWVLPRIKLWWSSKCSLRRLECYRWHLVRNQRWEIWIIGHTGLVVHDFGSAVCSPSWYPYLWRDDRQRGIHPRWRGVRSKNNVEDQARTSTNEQTKKEASGFLFFSLFPSIPFRLYPSIHSFFHSFLISCFIYSSALSSWLSSGPIA